MTSQKKEKISIIIPVFNIKDYVKRCVESVICQTYKNLEIILVDDGSTDGSGSICDQFEKKDKRIIVIHQDNAGLSAARNAGISVSTGSFICFVDGDDFISPTMISVLYNNLVEYNADVSCCDFITIFNPNDYCFTENNNCSIVDNPLYELMISHRLIVNVWNKLYKKDLFDKIKFPVGLIYEDLATTYKILDRCDKIVVSNAKLYAYVQREQSIMSKSRTIIKIDKISILYDMWKYLENTKKEDYRLFKAVLTYLMNDIYRILTYKSLSKNKRYVNKAHQLFLDKKEGIKKYSLMSYKDKTVLWMVYHTPHLIQFLYRLRLSFGGNK